MIREYRQNDLDELLDAWQTASRRSHWFLPDSFFDEERTNIATTHLPLAETWVYEEAGRVVGFIALIENEVGGIFVHTEYQGKGIGRRLMDHAASLQPSLVLNVFEENSQARTFYEKYGFTKIGEVMHEATRRNQIRMEWKENL